MVSVRTSQGLLRKQMVKAITDLIVTFFTYPQHPFLKISRPLATLHPLIVAAKDAAKGH